MGVGLPGIGGAVLTQSAGVSAKMLACGDERSHLSGAAAGGGLEEHVSLWPSVFRLIHLNGVHPQPPGVGLWLFQRTVPSLIWRRQRS